MNLQKLAQLNAENRAAQIYFFVFASRHRSPPRTTVQEVIDLARRERYQPISPGEVEAFFEALEAADCGQFVRDEGEKQFLWLLKVVTVSRAARENHPEFAASAAETPEIEAVSHTLRLRADWILTLELPPDFTPAEAQRICHFVQALPLESKNEAPAS